LKVSGYDTCLLVIAGGVPSELKDFGSQVLEHSGKVNRGTSTDALSVVSFLQETVNAANGKLD
jgi:hypothetical protein